MVNDERGQLILVGALLVAATIIGSITLLNTIHESPEVKTEQDGRTLQDTELKMSEVHSNLERLFLYNVSMNETGEPLPYANSSFEGVVEEYQSQSMNLSSTTTAGVLNITYLDGESLTGGIAKQNATDDGYRPFPTDSSNQTVIQNAKTLPRMVVVVNETNAGFTINITNTSADVGLDFSGSGELRKKPIGGTSTLICSPPSGFDSETDGRIELDLINGSGSVTYVTGTGPDRMEVEYCGDITFGASMDPTLDVEFDNPGADPANGTFVVTGTDIDPSDSTLTPDANRNYRARLGGDPLVVNPKFKVEYRTPNLTYNSTFALYNTTGR